MTQRTLFLQDVNDDEVIRIDSFYDGSVSIEIGDATDEGEIFALTKAQVDELLAFLLPQNADEDKPQPNQNSSQFNLLGHT